MADEKQAPPEGAVQVSFPEEKKGGAYANALYVGHSQEEFVLDFLFVAPPAGTVVSRVVVSPGHLKRIVAALSENLRKYEGQFGPVADSKGPSDALRVN